ncbi:MAG: hypothetical protein JWM93_2419 [Frankiales bacterium]|jgi:hypothetical protein|nr:hypothetical protein [Frankiales bacterium]
MVDPAAYFSSTKIALSVPKAFVAFAARDVGHAAGPDGIRFAERSERRAQPNRGRHPDYKTDFDTGLISPAWQSDWTDVTGTLPANRRPYGKGPAQPTKPNGSFYTDFPQPRTAYCAIYKKLKATGYPTQQSGVPCP